jgi:hypothetical protein
MAEIGLLSDLEIFSTNMTIAQVATTELGGDFALSVGGSSGTQNNKIANILPKTDANLAEYLGQIRGSLTLDIRPKVLQAQSSERRIGLTAMQSQRDVQTAGNLYFGYVLYSTVEEDQIVAISKSVSGLDAALVILASDPYLMVVDTTFSFRFVWDYDADSGQILLQCWIGPDRANLTKVVEYIDPSPLTTSVGEGFGHVGLANGLSTWYVDDLQLAEV